MTIALVDSQAFHGFLFIKMSTGKFTDFFMTGNCKIGSCPDHIPSCVSIHDDAGDANVEVSRLMCHCPKPQVTA